MASQRHGSVSPDSLLEMDFEDQNEWPILNREAINARPPPPPPLPSSSNPSQENQAIGGGLDNVRDMGQRVPMPGRPTNGIRAFPEHNADVPPPPPPPPPAPAPAPGPIPQRRYAANDQPPQAANVPPPPPPPPPPPQRRYENDDHPHEAAPGPARHARAGRAARRRRVYDPQMRLINLLYKMANPYRGRNRGRGNHQNGGEGGDQGGGGNLGAAEGADNNNGWA